MMLTWNTVLLILLMGVATYATRILGYLLMRGREITGRTKTVLDAVPVSVLTAVIAPTVFLQGPAEFIAGGVTLIAALRGMPLIGTILAGMASVVVFRLLLTSAGYMP